MQEWGCAPCPFLCDMNFNVYVTAPEAPTIIDESSIIFQILIPSLPFISLLLIPFRYSRTRWTSNVTNQLRLCLNCCSNIWSVYVEKSHSISYVPNITIIITIPTFLTVPSAVSLVRRHIPTSLHTGAVLEIHSVCFIVPSYFFSFEKTAIPLSFAVTNCGQSLILFHHAGTLLPSLASSKQAHHALSHCFCYLVKMSALPFVEHRFGTLYV